MTVSQINPLIYQLTKSTQLSTLDNKLLQEYSFYNPDIFEYQKTTDIYQRKKELVAQIYPSINSLLQQLKFNNREEIIDALWSFWLPLALELATKRRKQKYPFIVGILGTQGTGKTTLTRILSIIWQYLDLSCAAISIDDLYKTYGARQELLKIDSRLIWRGPPGTHDVKLGIDTLNQLQNGEQSVLIPRFDKSAYNGKGDRTSPQKVNPVDIIILEGWFVGVTPVPEEQLQNTPFPIISDADKQFAKDNNQRLKEYLPLWQKLDYLMILNPQEYQYSLQWRKEAEHKMIAQGKTGMTDEEIEQFVYYFWKALHPEIYIKPLTQSNQKTDLVINLNLAHHINHIYRP